jgi:purine-cytosine permease-like protein
LPSAVVGIVTAGWAGVPCVVGGAAVVGAVVGVPAQAASETAMAIAIIRAKNFFMIFPPRIISL